MLAAVDPSAFADSMEEYIGSLPSDQVRALALRTSQSLPQPERAQLEMYVDPKTLTGAGDDLIGRRFTAFLRQNPRSAEYLGPDALERIFLPLENPQTVALSKRRFSLGAAGLTLLAFVVAVVPLAAQYAHQRGMLNGLSDAAVVAPVAVAQAPKAGLRPARPESTRTHFRRPATHVAHKGTAVRHVAVVQRHEVRPRRIARRAARIRGDAPPRRIASIWKFDRRNYKYVSPEARSLSERARLEVQSYLNALIAGNTRSALQHLGLPPDADMVNLSEVPIVSRRSRARVVLVKAQPDGKTQVDADIRGRGGEYFEVFYVAADGPAVRITDRYYIPVGSQTTR